MRDENATVQLQVRMREDLRRDLQRNAKARRISLNQEIIDRLEYVRDRKDLLAEVLTTAYGSKEVAGLVMLLGQALQDAGFARYVSGRRWPDVLAEGRGAWVTDYDAYVQALQAVQRVLDALRPPAGNDIKKNPALTPGTYSVHHREWSRLGTTVANQRLASVHASYYNKGCGSADDAPDPRFLAVELTVADLLGALAARIATHPDDDHTRAEDAQAAHAKSTKRRKSKP